MERVTGIGGIFFKAKDPAALSAWYEKHLGLPISPWGGAVVGREEGTIEARNATVIWSPFREDSSYFAPSEKPFMLNFRVASLDPMLAQLRAAGVQVDERVERSEQGAFGWCMDPEGNRIELWEPPTE